jgi:tetratricopeptide (TPR) repeat protein
MANGPSFEKMFRLAVDQLMRLRALKPDDLDNVADLGTVHGLRAVHLRQNIGTPAAMQEALGEYQQSLAVMRPEYEKHPDHLVLAGNYGKVNGYTGLLLSEIDRAEESLPYHHRSVEVSDALVQKDPGDVRARIEQAEAHGRLGMALADLGRTDEAIRAQQQSLEAFERLPDSTRNEVVVQFNLATAHRELGETLRKRAGPGDEERACVQFRTSQTLFDDNLKRRAESALTRNAVSALRKALAQCH